MTRQEIVNAIAPLDHEAALSAMKALYHQQRWTQLAALGGFPVKETPMNDEHKHAAAMTAARAADCAASELKLSPAEAGKAVIDAYLAALSRLSAAAAAGAPTAPPTAP